MKIIISPAKTMRVDTETIPVQQVPAYREETEKLLKVAKEMSFAKLQKMFGTSDKLTQENLERFANMDLDKDLTPAILAYEGQVYQHIDIRSLGQVELDYLQNHLRILSGFYGIVKPLDGIVTYRLEMGNKIKVGKKENLYEFWGTKLYKDLYAENDVVINLASKEYFQVISKHLKDKDRFITVEFAKIMNGKLRQLGMESKMARGEMVRFMAQNQVEELEQLHDFTFRDLHYSQEHSDDKKLVFLKA